MPSSQAKVVAITGGGRGIGLATARAFAQAGAKVSIADIDGDGVARAAQLIGNTHAARLDVTDRAAFERYVAEVEAAIGPIDVLVNNAGIMPIGPMLIEREETARRVLEVNVLGVLNGMAAVLPSMLARYRGHIFNMASVAGKAPVPGGVSYAASKAAIVSITESARVEHAESGIAFTCVMPSFTATDLIAGTKGTKFLKTVQPEDVGKAILRGVERPRADVYVPAAIGVIVRLQPLLGRRLRDASQRWIGAYDTFLDIDVEARKEYERRIAARREAVSEETSALSGP